MIAANGCVTNRLDFTTNSGSGRTTNCDWSSATQCVKVTKASISTRCGTNNVEFDSINPYTSNIKVVSCFQRTDGT